MTNVQDDRATVERIMVGSWAVGEQPAPFRYQFLDSDGEPFDITGWTAKIRWVTSGTEVVTHPATVLDQTALTGWVEYEWAPGDFDAAGVYDGNFWIDGGDNVFASVDLGWKIRVPATPSPF